MSSHIKKIRLFLQTICRTELIEMLTREKRNFIFVAKYINNLHLSGNKDILWVGCFLVSLPKDYLLCSEVPALNFFIGLKSPPSL